MILSAQSIRTRLSNRITPFNERTVQNGMSYGLSCAGYDIRIANWHRLRPGDFVLATTVEHIDLPTDVLAQLADKSTWARRGIAMQNTIFEPGWRGYPTIEISNHGTDTIYINEGDPIAQLIFHQIDRAVEKPYRGKYQDQPQVPVPALEEGYSDE